MFLHRMILRLTRGAIRKIANAQGWGSQRGGRQVKDIKWTYTNSELYFILSGGFKHFLFSTLLGEMIQFD